MAHIAQDKPPELVRVNYQAKMAESIVSHKDASPDELFIRAFLTY